MKTFYFHPEVGNTYLYFFPTFSDDGTMWKKKARIKFSRVKARQAKLVCIALKLDKKNLLTSWGADRPHFQTEVTFILKRSVPRFRLGFRSLPPTWRGRPRRAFPSRAGASIEDTGELGWHGHENMDTSWRLTSNLLAVDLDNVFAWIHRGMMIKSSPRCRCGRRNSNVILATAACCLED